MQASFQWVAAVEGLRSSKCVLVFLWICSVAPDHTPYPTVFRSSVVTYFLDDLRWYNLKGLADDEHVVPQCAVLLMGTGCIGNSVNAMSTNCIQGHGLEGIYQFGL